MFSPIVTFIMSLQRWSGSNWLLHCARCHVEANRGQRGCQHLQLPETHQVCAHNMFSRILKLRILNLLEGESQNLRLINHHFTTVSSHFFAISIIIFHETEILTVILRCCMDLYLNWFSSYGPKRENFRFRFLLIL